VLAGSLTSAADDYDVRRRRRLKVVAQLLGALLRSKCGQLRSFGDAC
jgi:hypothetical protein